MSNLTESSASIQEAENFAITLKGMKSDEQKMLFAVMTGMRLQENIRDSMEQADSLSQDDEETKGELVGMEG